MTMLRPPPSSPRRRGPITPGVHWSEGIYPTAENASPRRRDERICAHAGVPARRPGQRQWIFRIHQTTTRLTHNSAFSRQNPPEVCKFICPQKKIEGAGDPQDRGRREDRVRAAPAVSCAKMRLAKAHTSIQVQRKQSGLPCAMVLQLISCSPRRDLACLSPSFPRSVSSLRT